MNVYRSKRGWLAGFVAAVLWLITEIGLQAVGRVFEDEVLEGRNGGSFFELVATGHLTLFGTRPLQLAENDGWVYLALPLSAGLGVLIVGLVAFLAARGGAPGSSVIPVFLSTWLGAVLASAVTAGVFSRIANRRFYETDERFSGRYLLDSISYGAFHGLQFGIFAALLTALAWLIIRPRPSAVPPGAGPLPNQPRQDFQQQGFQQQGFPQPGPAQQPPNPSYAAPGDDTPGPEPTRLSKD